ncbi:MAG: DMT family transporter [Pseudomonadota bacterium]
MNRQTFQRPLPSSLLQRRPDFLPVLAIILGAAMWGLFWLPVRAIGEAGVSPAWASPLIFAAASMAIAPVALYRLRHFAAGMKNIFLGGFLAGLAFALYSISFNLTEVVRVQLLFYTTPVWSTILGILLLGEALRLNRVLALLLGFGGLLVVLGADGQFPWPRNWGDWFALASGIAWSFASVQLIKGGTKHIFEKTALFVFCALITSVILALLPFDIADALPTQESVQKALPALIIVAVLIVPAAFLTIWPTTLLSPARVGILFMFEMVVGISTAAWLTDEPFGLREIAGTILIMGAALVEVMPKRGDAIKNADPKKNVSP